MTDLEKLKKVKYRMCYVSGGGTTYDGGEWEIKETPKTVVFTCINNSFFSSHCPTRMIIRKEKERTHCLRKGEDGTYVVYPYQNGTPHIFEPMIVSIPAPACGSEKEENDR